MHKSIVGLGIALGLVGCAHKGTTTPPSETPAAATSAPDIDAGMPHEGMHHEGMPHEGMHHEGMHHEGMGKMAEAKLEPKSGNTTLKGHAEFMATPAGVKLMLHVEGAPPGQHGAHIHETGDCSDPEAKSAGGHWNPAGHHHGAPPPSSSHLGDLGNLTVGENGMGHLELSSTDWKSGDGSANDVIGKAIVIHGGADDLASDPAGNSGPRIGCGVIAAHEGGPHHHGGPGEQGEHHHEGAHPH